MSHDQFRPVRVKESRREGKALTALTLDLTDTGLAKAHAVPGQYVRARVPGASAEAYFALANAPGAAAFELLVQATGEPGAARALSSLGAGDSLEITAPLGKGFPVEGERGRDLWLFAGGSGISAIRSIVEWVAEQRTDYGRVVLLFGARTREQMAYQAFFAGWRGARIEVEPVLSRPEDATWKGRVGHVQHALEHLGRPEAARASAFLAGGKQFLEAVTAALLADGIERARIFRNY